LRDFSGFFRAENIFTNRNIFSATAQKFSDTASWLKRKRLRKPLRKRRSNVRVATSLPSTPAL
jgi:hypothetical protein